MITEFAPTLPWAEARAAFLAAYGAEKLYDDTIWTPAYHAAEEHAGTHIPDEVTEQIERLEGARCDAEDVMIAAVAPDIGTIITKIEYGRHRWRDCGDWPDAWWNAVLGDLRRFAALRDPHMDLLAELFQALADLDASFVENANREEPVRNRLQEIEKRIETTPATSRDGILAKAIYLVDRNVGSDEGTAFLEEARALGIIPAEVA